MNRTETQQTPPSGKRKGLVALIAAGWILIALFLAGTLTTPADIRVSDTPASVDVKKAFEQNVQIRISSDVDAPTPQKIQYTLNDHDLVAPKPDAGKYGVLESTGDLPALLQQAAGLLDSQTTLLTEDAQLMEGTSVNYYLDDTILAMTWKQIVDDGVYTFSEVKIAHPSQLRRFLADGTFGASAMYTTTEMAESVNAVLASSGDFYGYRSFGVVVNEGKVYRGKGKFLDTCYIDENGDLLFTYAEEIMDEATAQAFVDEHNVRFSLTFGPVMILDNQNVVPGSYNTGEIKKNYARAALCQLGPLHYAVVAANYEEPYYHVPTVKQFAQRLQEMGVPTAYALDGGQTASIVLNNQLINAVSYGCQRKISDILYFATAIPNQ